MIEFEAFFRCDGCGSAALEGDLQAISLGSLAETGHVCSMECVGTFIGKRHPRLPVRATDAAEVNNRVAAERATELAKDEALRTAHEDLVARVDKSRKEREAMKQARREAIQAALKSAQEAKA